MRMHLDVYMTSTRLAVRTGEETCSPSTVTLSPSPTSVARWISPLSSPETDVTTQTAPSPAKSAKFRRASVASRQPSESVMARANRCPAAPRSGEKSSCVRVASRTT